MISRLEGLQGSHSIIDAIRGKDLRRQQQNSAHHGNRRCDRPASPGSTKEASVDRVEFGLAWSNHQLPDYDTMVKAAC